jgi:hypothetical protein
MEATVTKISGRRRKLPPIMGAQEVAARLGIASSNLDRTVGLPAPADKVAATRIWLAEEIEAFAVEREARRERRVAADEAA